MFLLSHHHPDEWNRCYTLGGFKVCARCLGVYPAALLMLVAEFALRAPLVARFDAWMGTALVLPATVDWAVGRFRPGAGSNAQRTATGVLLGIGLGRSLYIHVQQPFPTVLIAQLVLVTLVVLPVIFATYSRPRGG